MEWVSHAEFTEPGLSIKPQIRIYLSASDQSIEGTRDILFLSGRGIQHISLYFLLIGISL